MRFTTLAKVILCLAPSLVLGSLAYWFYIQPSIQLQQQRQTAIEKAGAFLNRFLWNETAGAYRECPTYANASCAQKYNRDDNYLAYIFNTEYSLNLTKAKAIHQFLTSMNFTYYNRWIVLSNYSANYTQYPCTTCNPPTPYTDRLYGDHAALDGIHDWKLDNVSGASAKLSFLVSHMLDSKLDLFRDNATDSEGFVYYKLSLALILASELKNSTYTAQFSATLAAQQNLDGSWLTGPAQPAGVFPNTESTILDIVALKLAWNL